MTQTLPYIFANASGLVPASQLDDNFQFLLDLIGTGGSTPTISYIPPGLTAPVSPGASAGTATVAGLSGGVWSLSPTTYFQINAVTGAVTAATTVEDGTYSFTITYTGAASGQTITVSLNTGVVVSSSPGGSNGTLDFTNPANSGLVDDTF